MVERSCGESKKEKTKRIVKDILLIASEAIINGMIQFMCNSIFLKLIFKENNWFVLSLFCSIACIFTYITIKGLKETVDKVILYISIPTIFSVLIAIIASFILNYTTTLSVWCYSLMGMIATIIVLHNQKD